MLVVNQRRRQHFFGELEKLQAEGARDDRRILDQVRHFVQQSRLGADDAADAALQPLRLGVEFAGDLVVAFAALEDDEVLEQARAILVERSTLMARPARPLVVRKRWP